MKNVLFRTELKRHPRALARDIVNAVAAHRSAGTSPVDDVAELCDEAVLFTGAVGALVELHLDRAIFSAVAAAAVYVVQITLDRAADGQAV